MKYLLEEGKKRVSDSIFRKWQEDWFNECQNTDLLSREKVFFDTFKMNYKYAKIKAKINKNKNFAYKYIFMFLIIALPIVVFILRIIKPDLFVQYLDGNIIWSVLFYFAWVFTAWIATTKHQETWIRHSKAAYLIEQEMLKFIEGMEDYDYSKTTRKQEFKKNMIIIWKENQKTFQKNMKKDDMKDILKK